MLGKIEEVGPDPVDGAAAPLPGQVGEEHLGAIARKQAHGIPQSEPSCRPRLPGPWSRTDEAHDGTERDEHLTDVTAEQHPVRTEVAERTGERNPGAQLNGHRRAELSRNPGDELDSSELASSSVRDLGIQVAAGFGVPLRLEVGEEPFPPHARGSHARGSYGLTSPRPRAPRQDPSTFGLWELPHAIKVYHMRTMSNDVKRWFLTPDTAVSIGGLAALIGMGATALTLWWSLVLGPSLATWRGSSAPRPADALLTVVAAAAFILGSWLLLGILLDVLAQAPGALGQLAACLSARITPRLARQVVAGILGLGATTVLLPPASVAGPGGQVLTSTTDSPTARPFAEAQALPTSTAGRTPAWTALDSAPAMQTIPAQTIPGQTIPEPGWVAPAPVVRPLPDPGMLSGPSWAPVPDGEVVVLRGDSLWTIAARHLGPEATDAEIAVAWPRWYAANRAVIGSDADRLLPGQILQAPSLSGGSR